MRWRQAQEGGDVCVCVYVCMYIAESAACVQQKLTQHRKAITLQV